MFQRILVPLDGSKGAEHAIPLAARLARSAGGSVVFLQVLSPVLLRDRETGSRLAIEHVIEREAQALLEASTYLASVLATYAEELVGTSPEIAVAVGPVSPRLTSTVQPVQADLVVMGRHQPGQWGREKSAGQAIPQQIGALLLLKEQGMDLRPDRVHPPRVVVPLDGSLFAEMVLEPVLHLLAQLSFLGGLSSEIHLVRVVAEHSAEYEHAERYLHAIKARLRKQFHVGENCLVTSSVVVGDEVVETLLEQVNATGGTPLLALTTHRREGRPRQAGGNIAERVLDRAPCPVLLVHPGETTGRSATRNHLAASEKRERIRRGHHGAPSARPARWI